MSVFELKPEDLVVSLWSKERRGSWSTAQENGVCITHRPTGAQVMVDSDSSHHRNKAIAMKMLTEKVERIMAERKAAKAQPEYMKLVAVLEKYLLHAMPSGTVIGDPTWWAPRLARVVQSVALQTAPCDSELPALPECDGDWAGDDWFTADSMRAYGRLCLAARQPAQQGEKG